MTGCLTATVSATPVELLQAYNSDNEEFYGIEVEEMSEQKSAFDSDEDELGSSDSEPDTLRQSLSEHDSEQVRDTCTLKMPNTTGQSTATSPFCLCKF